MTEDEKYLWYQANSLNAMHFYGHWYADKAGDKYREAVAELEAARQCLERQTRVEINKIKED